MKMKKNFDFSKRKHTFVVGGSGSGLSRCTICPQLINEFVKELKETNKEYQNGKNQGK
ncbi:hypothetical protein [Bacillus pseudomycoides]|uniref:hypothetical protein n=1 Tax=Bacillus pseudomycoides TaxID=64104 RepID=UPI00159BADAA|nr:hypothetical protein [Bacillus pseudomycoides]